MIKAEDYHFLFERQGQLQKLGEEDCIANGWKTE